MGAQGITTITFGSFPGSTDASVTITGQTSITANSLVEAWIFPSGTVDHSADEHVMEPIRVIAGNIVAGTGFTIYAFSAMNLEAGMSYTDGQLLYGQWAVAWVWN